MDRDTTILQKKISWRRLGSMWLLLSTMLALAGGVEQVAQELAGLGVHDPAATSSSDDFQVADDFYSNKCRPCVPRSEYRIQVIVHGTDDDVFWQQVRSAMEQAGRDAGVAVDMELFQATNATQEIHSRMASKIRRAITRTPDQRPDALIVTLPSEAVHQAVALALKVHMPVFGFHHSGNEEAKGLGLLGFVAQDEELAGRRVAQELLPRLQGRQNNMKKVLFVNHDDQSPAMSARYQGLRLGVLEGSAAMDDDVVTMQLTVDPRDVFGTVQKLNDDVFLGCPYDAVVLGGESLVDIAVSGFVDLGCSDKVVVASFGMSQQMVEAIGNRHVAFTAAPQPYIEAVFVVVMASMFVTTGKKLSLPPESNIYLSGPVIATSDNLPTEAAEICRQQAFPVCNSDGQPFGPIITVSTTGSSSSTLLCNDSGCLPRHSIRIGGVLHGVATDLFWDPVFAAARQAALDLGIQLELERIDKQETDAILFAKMSARIESLCQSGVKGIFVTIPDDTVLDSIRLCQSLKIPVISVNSGVEKSRELGLLLHVGQMEYNAGYGAGLRLAKEGIKEAFCLNHQPGNAALVERCRGFGHALETKHPYIAYHGMVATNQDSQELYQQAVEDYVAEYSLTSDSWEDIGLLVLGPGQVDSAMQLLQLRPNAVVGSFDLSENMFGPLNDGRLKFGIDQQPFLQGHLPVVLLTYAAYTQQTLVNDVVETGPKFVDSVPSPDEKQCEATFYAICNKMPEENMNMISSGLLILGFVLVSLTCLSALLCICFVLYYQKTSALIRLSQPTFLISLCTGCIVSIVSIIPMGIQTGYRFIKDSSMGELTASENPDINAVDAACMMVPWFYSVGFWMVFSSLFGKICGIQRIFKSAGLIRRSTVTFMDIAPYTTTMAVVVLGLLIAWQIVSPFQWDRSLVLSDNDGFPLESNGRCTSEQGWVFGLAVLCFQVLCLFYALVLCFQMKHIVDDLSENSNTFLAVICMFQVNVLAMPIMATVRDDTQVFYLVRAGAVFLQNYSVLCIMFIPKIYRIFAGEDVLPELSRSTRYNVGFKMQLNDSTVGAGSNSRDYNAGASEKFQPRECRSSFTDVLGLEVAKESAPTLSSKVQSCRGGLMLDATDSVNENIGTAEHCRENHGDVEPGGAIPFEQVADALGYSSKEASSRHEADENTIETFLDEGSDSVLVPPADRDAAPNIQVSFNPDDILSGLSTDDDFFSAVMEPDDGMGVEADFEMLTESVHTDTNTRKIPKRGRPPYSSKARAKASLGSREPRKQRASTSVMPTQTTPLNFDVPIVLRRTRTAPIASRGTHVPQSFPKLSDHAPALAPVPRLEKREESLSGKNFNNYYMPNNPPLRRLATNPEPQSSAQAPATQPAEPQVSTEPQSSPPVRARRESFTFAPNAYVCKVCGKVSPKDMPRIGCCAGD